MAGCRVDLRGRESFRVRIATAPHVQTYLSQTRPRPGLEDLGQLLPSTPVDSYRHHHPSGLRPSTRRAPRLVLWRKFTPPPRCLRHRSLALASLPLLCPSARPSPSPRLEAGPLLARLARGVSAGMGSPGRGTGMSSDCEMEQILVCVLLKGGKYLLHHSRNPDDSLGLLTETNPQ